MGLFDRFKKKESAPNAPETIRQPDWLEWKSLMEGIPDNLSVREQEDLEEKTTAVFSYKDEDPERAFWRLLELAHKGCAEAMCLVSQCYEFAEGVEPERKECLRWRWRAACLGHTEAMLMVGYELEEGEKPINKDLVEAFRWYVKAAVNGSETAKEEVEDYIDTIRDGLFREVYGGTAAQAMEITNIYKTYIG